MITANFRHNRLISPNGLERLIALRIVLSRQWARTINRKRFFSTLNLFSKNTTRGIKQKRQVAEMSFLSFLTVWNRRNRRKRQYRHSAQLRIEH